jgi:hypothetical protein
MAWIATIASAGIGLYSANKKSRAADAANAQNMAGFNQYKPYTDRALSGGEAAKDARLSAGFYGGPTYAGPNNYQTNAATGYGNASMGIMNRGFDMANANSGFGDNARGLYDQYQGMAGDASAQGRMDTANQYALDNMNPLVTAAMRDDRRNLQENTLTGIDMAASGSGNTNSSRAGVAEAVANRAFDDRRADVSSQVIDSLRTQSLGEQRQAFSDRGNALMNAGAANNSIENAYNSGMNTGRTGYDMGMNAGGALQGYDQARMNDDRMRFEGNRDFASNVYADYKNGMLTQNGPNTSNKYSANYSDPLGSAITGGIQGYGFANSPYQEGGQKTWGQQIGGWFGS